MDLNKLSDKRLIAYIQSSGKKANQRLVQIEKAGLFSYPAYQYISSKVPTYLTDVSASGHLKLDIKTRGLSHNDLMQKANIIKKFLSSKTSTLRGINKSIEKAKRKFEENIGKSITKTEYGILWTSSITKFYESIFGSQQIVQWVKDRGVEGTLSMLAEAYAKNYTTLIDVEYKKEEVGDINIEDSNL